MKRAKTALVFRDVIMLELLGFATIVVLLLPHLHPSTEIADPVKIARANSGQSMARWLDVIDVHVDLWAEVACRQEALVIPTKAAESSICCVTISAIAAISAPSTTKRRSPVRRPAGNYSVNLHLYRNNSTELPIEVEVEVCVEVRHRTQMAVPNLISLARRSTCRMSERLRTVVRFALDENGGLDRGQPPPIATSSADVR